MTAGGNHSCALADGRAYCWGGNQSGQLGDGTFVSKSGPVAVAGALAGKVVSAISAGMIHTCALAEGRAYCWGFNGSGRVGDDSTTTRSAPVAVATPDVLKDKTITAIAAGDEHTCALADGRPSCGEKNQFGQLGDVSTVDRLVPVAVVDARALWVGGETVTGIRAGGDHTCEV